MESTEYTNDALTKMLHAGMGRAIFYLLKHESVEYQDIILDCCLHNRAYDMQIEEDRAAYLYPLISRLAERDFYRDKIIGALKTADCGFDAAQLLDLAVSFAREGDSGARDGLYEYFQRQGLGRDFNGVRQIVELDGIGGLLFVLNQFNPDHPLTDDWDAVYPIRIAEERCGVEPVRQALAEAAQENPRIARVLDAISKSYTPSLGVDDVLKTHQRDLARVEEQTTVQSLTWSEFRGRKDYRTWIGRWAKAASDQELENAARYILSVEDPERLHWYLHAFWHRPFPLYPRLLIRLMHSPNHKVCNSALNALARIEHPEVRRLFDELVHDPEWSDTMVGLLPRNYREGDHLLLEELLTREMGIEALHSVGLDIIQVFERNPIPESVRALLFIYENGPCAHCRCRCVELLHKLGALPQWMIEECVYDAHESARALARELLDRDGG